MKEEIIGELEKISKETFKTYYYFYGINSFSKKSIEKNLLYLGLEASNKRNFKPYATAPHFPSESERDAKINMILLTEKQREILMWTGLEYLTQFSNAVNENQSKKRLFKTNLPEQIYECLKPDYDDGLATALDFPRSKEITNNDEAKKQVFESLCCFHPAEEAYQILKKYTITDVSGEKAQKEEHLKNVGDN